MEGVKKDRPIWFTDELMELIKDKDTIISRALKTNDSVDRVIARNARNRTYLTTFKISDYSVCDVTNPKL